MGRGGGGGAETLDPFHGEDLAGAEIGVDAWHHQPFDVPVQLPESDAQTQSIYNTLAVGLDASRM